MNELNRDSVLLFTGGGKGITAECAVALSSQLPCSYLLLGRSEPMALPEWFNGTSSEQEIKQQILAQAKANNEKLSPKEIERKYQQLSGSWEISSTLLKIEANGARVKYVSADVTDAQQLKEALSTAEAEFGTITGLVHGAGRLADKRIERKTEEDFAAVYGTKVDGLNAVLACLDPAKLQLMVLFSSVAGAFGNVGQADYAMANEYLTRFSFQFQQQHPQCHTVSINWGPWDSGMVTPMLKEAFAQMGITLISMEEGTRQFVDEVLRYSHPSPQLVFGNKIERPVQLEFPEEMIQVKRTIYPDENPFLLDHQIGPNRVLPATCAASWISDTCEQLFPTYHFVELLHYRVLKGLVFEDHSPREFVVSVKVVSTEPTGQIELETNVSSVMEDREVIHYTASISLRQEVPPAPVREDLKAKTTLPILKDGHTFYTEKVLFHGPAFQGFQSVLQVADMQLTTICHLPAVDEVVQGQFTTRSTNPYANDVVLQGILAWSFHNHEKVCLPAGIERIKQYIPLPFDVDLFVDVEVISQTKTRARANAVIFDKTGRVYMEADGIDGTMSKALRALFRQSATSEDHQPQPQTVAAE